jgi:hypothetical protein
MNSPINYQLLFIAFIRFLSIIPLTIMLFSISKTYWDKRHCINGLRKTRVVLMFFFLGLWIDNFLFIFANTQSALSMLPNVQVNIFYTYIDKIILAISYYVMYYLFLHAAKKD